MALGVQFIISVVLYIIILAIFLGLLILIVRCLLKYLKSIGVSRQAVSKWENGASDPSTSNLLALAKLYGISAEDLLKEVE